MELIYRRYGDYYLPNIGIPAEDIRPHGKYGRMRRRYLREHRSLLFNQLLCSGKLMKHLYSIDDACQERMDLLISQIKAAVGVIEELKATDQMEWVRRMNSTHNQIEEMLFNELILIEELCCMRRVCICPARRKTRSCRKSQYRLLTGFSRRFRHIPLDTLREQVRQLPCPTLATAAWILTSEEARRLELVKRKFIQENKKTKPDRYDR